MRAWYNVNTRKALETILWFTDRQTPIDFYHILKVLFFADKRHLNDYGRPILGDTYEALPHGPVARTVYALLKRDDALEAQFLAEHAGTDQRYPILVSDRYWVRGERHAGLDFFSESDLEALDWAFREYSGKDFDELKTLTHQEKAWRNARERGSIIMLYEDMLEAGSNTLPSMQRQIARSAPQMRF